MTRHIAPLLVIVAVSCSTPEQVSSQAFLDIDSLITSQVAFLSRANAKVEKKAGIGDELTDAVVAPDSAGWSDELSVFRQLELAERPVNRDRYIVQETDDSRSNLKVRSYVAKSTEEDEDTPVPYIHLYYLKGINDIRRIEAGYYETNLLYTSKRDLILEFEEMGGASLLRRYSINGYQRVIMADSVHFSVEAEVIF
jgi:hypothetical protein